ncbi:hypothetical protein [Streptomyces microflavus]|uniref:hypothetical protein n=1 Tax=Streptomyces microflavus TaxID=1919 RepID=UPI0036992EF1
MAVQSPRIMDCTLREGTYETTFTPADAAHVARFVHDAGVHHIEVGVDNGVAPRVPYAADAYVAAVLQAVPEASVGVMVVAPSVPVETIERALQAGASFVRVAVNATQIRMALPLLEKAKSLGAGMVTLNAMKTYALPELEVLGAAAEAYRAGADVFYVVDSAGCMLPDQVSRLVRHLGDVGVASGFHGHDNFSLAVANSLAALQAGATVIDGTLRGTGRSAGNAQIEVLVKAAQRQGHFTAIDGDLLAETGEELIAARRLRDRGITYLDLVIGEGRFHTECLDAAREVAETHGVSLHRLVREVGRRDPLAPSRELIESVALDLGRGVTMESATPEETST